MAGLGLGLGLHKVGGIVPFDPSSIPNLKLWFDASDESTLTLVSGSVAGWTEKVNGFTLAQGTASKRPESGHPVNGLNGVLFDGGDDFLSLSGLGAYFSSNTATTYMVIKFVADLASNGSMVTSTSATAGYVSYSGWAQSGTQAYTRIGARVGSVSPHLVRGDQLMSSGGLYLIKGSTNGSEYFLTLNNTAQTLTVIIGSNNGKWEDEVSPTSLYLGWVGVTGGAYAQGIFCEHLTFDRVLSTDEDTYITNGLATKWGVTLA